MKNKKAMELSLQTIAIMIIVVIVLIVMIIFFTSHFGSNSETFLNSSTSVINDASNSINF